MEAVSQQEVPEDKSDNANPGNRDRARRQAYDREEYAYETEQTADLHRQIRTPPRGGPFPPYGLLRTCPRRNGPARWPDAAHNQVTSSIRAKSRYSYLPFLFVGSYSLRPIPTDIFGGFVFISRGSRKPASLKILMKSFSCLGSNQKSRSLAMRAFGIVCVAVAISVPPSVRCL